MKGAGLTNVKFAEEISFASSVNILFLAFPSVVLYLSFDISLHSKEEITVSFGKFRYIVVVLDLLGILISFARIFFALSAFFPVHEPYLKNEFGKWFAVQSAFWYSSTLFRQGMFILKEEGNAISKYEYEKEYYWSIVAMGAFSQGIFCHTLASWFNWTKYGNDVTLFPSLFVPVIDILAYIVSPLIFLIMLRRQLHKKNKIKRY